MVISSWCNPVNGRIIPNGTILDIEPRFFNASHLEEVKEEEPKKEKKTKKNK